MRDMLAAEAAAGQYGDLVLGWLPRRLGHGKTLRQWTIANVLSAALAFSLD